MPTLPDNHIGQLNVAMSRADSSVPNFLDGFAKVTNGNPRQFPSSSTPYNVVESYSMFHVPVEQERLISCNSNGQSKSMLKSVTQQLCTELIKEAGHKPGSQPLSGHPLLSLPFKRKAITECTQDYQGHQKMSAPNKRVGQVGPNATAFGASQVSAPKNFPKSGASGRKVVQIEPVKNESRSNATKKLVQPQVSPKGQTESHESVRSKLRESLVSALALVSQEKEGFPDGKMKLQNEAMADIQEGQNIPSSNGTALLESPKDAKPLSKIPSSSGGCNVDDKTSLSFQSKEIFKEASQTESFLGTDFECNSVLPGDDSLFNSGLYFKDDFLQGNGLSWESDLNLHIPKVKETENIVKPVPMNEDTSDVERKMVRSPESVALAIESELFKLFGCVNKKYKEKGRSLLFNLKDRNNPELREKVMAGELPPDRLCSMTAEELASKELSQWRIAKAEELDHMKVLPDTDINMRRLVKKTHKGEYQVDFEPNSGPVEEIPVDIRISPSKRQKIDKFDRAVPPKAERTKGDDCEITIPSDGADIQGLMGDDLNDLPPVISLDEFMESLNKDPPFENLAVDSTITRGESDKENVEVGSKSLSPVQSPQYPVQKMSSDKVDVKKESPQSDVDKNLTGTPKYHVQKMSPNKVEVKMESPKTVGDKNLTGTLKPFDNNSVVQLQKGECVWEGQLQLNLSSIANFMALFKSGEKASCIEWARFFDIKGRVRHDAFDKFLQALPMSRSRAIMVCHFVLKDGYTESERSSLQELVDSYIADERVGFAEPGNGVELYLCVPRSKTVDMIVNHLPKSYTDKLNEIDDGLIAIVVRRKVQITSSVVSPISSSREQTVTKKQIGGQYVDNDMNRNNVFAPKRASSPPPNLSQSRSTVVEDDGSDDDDAPPGFGPPGSREDDDLPEFQFSAGSHPSMPSPPTPNPVSGRESGFQNHPRPPPLQVAQMRELIQKYGQNGNNAGGSGITTEPWNDDDDDIPEWQPQPVQNPVLYTHIANHQQSHMSNPQMLYRPQWPQVMQPGQPLQPLQPPMAVQQQRAWGLYGPESVGGLPLGQFLGSPSPGPGHLSRDWRSNSYKK
ncbi:hypothetical protein RND81_08G081100 [Saponaria officinalis]